MIKWALCGDYEDTRLLKKKLGDRATIYSWLETARMDKIEADIAYGYLVGVEDLKRRFGIEGQWLDYPPLRCQVYYAHWGKQLFNREYSMMPLREVQERVGDLPFFMRPDSNNKCFTGMVFDRKEVELLLTNNIGVDPETLVITAPLRDMSLCMEYRCFMRAGKYITGSSYKLLDDGSVLANNCDDNIWIRDYVEKNFPPYKDLPELYALDIIMDNSNIYNYFRLIELTCWSCAGLYDINLDKYIKTTEDAWKGKVNGYV